MNATRATTATAAVLAGLVLAAPVSATPSFGSNGLFGVDEQVAQGWATAYIPAGRYRVDQAPSMPPYQSAPGFWLRCKAFPCAVEVWGNVIAKGDAIRDVPTFVEIAPTDAGVRLYNVTLTRV
ncbi:hypothetical protein [Mycolicibacterium litorale]|uniref:Uncharacterized protein n=1 Tax=Mycolicibacterium litorale TaxID=758802 RepID=A0AAD1IQW9_9MYCO|nr:hypothetical protein [Mycolicibacterium litorale]MCV7418330.1 hypothetical protein [Mycolicibacterium litorale]TDY06275.1 hypothetical protein BCL50_2593 [Mycolicibacterium litorale]BBY19579.1 hypothetical protein MLIT_51710 [Mycolicibacterium litorale]